jgi:hypothetical protein
MACGGIANIETGRYPAGEAARRLLSSKLGLIAGDAALGAVRAHVREGWPHVGGYGFAGNASPEPAFPGIGRPSGAQSLFRGDQG